MLSAFLRPGPHRNYPAKHRKTIVLVPIGDVSEAPPFEALAECVAAFFQLPVKAGKPVTSKMLKRIEVCEEGCGFGPQFETSSIHRLIGEEYKDREAFLTIAYTMTDICNSNNGFQFLFGEALVDSGVGVFSFARYREDAPSAATFLRRCSHVLCHETTHLYGVKHCVWASCLMNGSNHLEESERRPFALCPCDLRKLEDSHEMIGGLDLLSREAALLAFFEKHGLERDVRLSKKLGAILAEHYRFEQKGAPAKR